MVVKALALTDPTNLFCDRSIDNPPVLIAAFFNTPACVKSSTNRHPVRLTQTRTTQYKQFISGALPKALKAKNILLKHLSVHKVDVLTNETLDLSFDGAM